ncbi:hypothetical protein C8R46DRAFT_1102549 [Mycena filopes]|nr:hypothetical protein C8R46DRAFT_1102549 [Mycena filopes]
MNLTQYYAKQNPKAAASNAGQKKTASGAGRLKEEDTIPLSLSNRKVSHYHFDDAPDSDVEEDDDQDVPPDELVLLVRQLRNTITQISRDEIVKFNRTHRVECPACTKHNRECRITASRVRCDDCLTKRRLCSRTDVFNQWMIRHRFKLSWEKAADTLKRGQQLLRDNPPPKAPRRRKTEEQARKPKIEEVVPALPIPTPTPPQSASTSREVRTSPRTPVPRIRKEPSGVVVPIEVPRPRPQKRPAPSGESRADHKRRKVAPVLKAEPEAKLAPPKPPPPKPAAPANAGREIVPASGSRKQVRLLVTAPTPVAPVAPIINIAACPILTARVIATEQRLDALEARQQKLEFGRTARQRVVDELNTAIAHLEGSGDIQSATERLRAIYASLYAEEEEESTSAGDGPPHKETQTLELHDDEQDAEGYLVDEEDLELPDHTPVLVDDDITALPGLMPIDGTNLLLTDPVQPTANMVGSA